MKPELGAEMTAKAKGGTALSVEHNGGRMSTSIAEGGSNIPS